MKIPSLRFNLCTGSGSVSSPESNCAPLDNNSIPGHISGEVNECLEIKNKLRRARVKLCKTTEGDLQIVI